MGWGAAFGTDSIDCSIDQSRDRQALPTPPLACLPARQYGIPKPSQAEHPSIPPNHCHPPTHTAHTNTHKHRQTWPWSHSTCCDSWTGPTSLRTPRTMACLSGCSRRCACAARLNRLDYIHIGPPKPKTIPSFMCLHPSPRTARPPGPGARVLRRGGGAGQAAAQHPHAHHGAGRPDEGGSVCWRASRVRGPTKRPLPTAV